jgi:hypothetical protein
MAVRANNFALRYFREDLAPRIVRKGLADVEALVAEVVKFEHDRVTLSAVGAGVRVEVLDEIGRALKPEAEFLDPSLFDVSRTIREIVLPAVCLAAWAAERVSLAALAATP